MIIIEVVARGRLMEEGPGSIPREALNGARLLDMRLLCLQGQH